MFPGNNNINASPPPPPVTLREGVAEIAVSSTKRGRADRTALSAGTPLNPLQVCLSLACPIPVNDRRPLAIAPEEPPERVTLLDEILKQ